MSYVSFYRKWRPQVFSEIVGQEYVVKTLQNAIFKNRISHSYIFCGPRGTGKTSLARVFAKGLNCEKGPTPNPCNKCSNCLSIAAGTNIDVIEIDAASNRGIDDIRELREKVKYLPVNLRKKVYIIDEAHQITPAAFNAFLKVLEEPPEHVIFIMATTEPHEVLPTIMSRCQRFDFEPIPVDKIRKRLKNIASSENINISDDAINLIARYADGSLRDADSILEQLSSFEDSRKINIDDVTSLLGIIDQDMLFELANIFLERNLSQALLFIQRVIASSFNLTVFTTEFLEHLYILYTIKNFDNPMDILDIGEDSRERYFNQTGLFTSEYIEYLMDIFSDLLKQLKWGESSKTFFKTTILRAINFDLIKEDQISNRFKNIDSALKKLQEIVSDRRKAEIKTDGKTRQDTELTQNKEIIDKNAVVSKNSGNKTVKKVKEDNLKDKNEDSISKKKYEKKDLLKKELEIKHSDYEKMIIQNWNDLLLRLREKNISIQAMFIETRGLRVDNNKIYFYLEEKKKWHKEHLAKSKNTMIIQQLLKDITGKSFQINFEVMSAKKDDNMLMIEDYFQDLSENKNRNTSKGNIKPDNSTGKENNNKEEILRYLEEKFNIKE